MTTVVVHDSLFHHWRHLFRLFLTNILDEFVSQKQIYHIITELKLIKLI